MIRMPLAAFAAFALFGLSATPASAFAITCTVTPTSDGFVALRERPRRVEPIAPSHQARRQRRVHEAR